MKVIISCVSLLAIGIILAWTIQEDEYSLEGIPVVFKDGLSAQCEKANEGPVKLNCNCFIRKGYDIYTANQHLKPHQIDELLLPSLGSCVVK